MKQFYILYVIPGILGLFLFIVSFFTNNQTVDIHIHDTYFVIAQSYFLAIVGLLLLFIWMLYAITKRILWKKSLSVIHIFLSLLFLLFLATLPLWYHIPTIKASFDEAMWREFRNFQKLNTLIVLVIFSFILVQLIYFVNLFTGCYINFIKSRKV
jgi:hypothetical protein